MVGDAVWSPPKQQLRAVVRVVVAVAIGSTSVSSTQRKSVVFRLFAIPLAITTAILVLYCQFWRGPASAAVVIREHQRDNDLLLANNNRVFHVNQGARVLSVGHIPVQEFAPEDYEDSHELVFRLNDAPTAGYEADVGKTTSIRILNNNVWRNSYNPTKDRDKGFHSNPMYHNVVLTVWEACLRRGPFSSCLSEIGTPYVRKGKKEKDDTIQPYFKRRQEFPEELFYFMNPDMLWDMWDMLQYFSPVPIVPRIPSTGFLAVFVSLWHCKMVDLVGFTPTVRFQRGKGGDHYFDAYSSGEWGSFNLFHPKATEMSLLYKLNSLPDDDVFIKGVMRLTGFSSVDCTNSKFA
ncbi:unnamed protein product [Notodromas monacha]|uniref:beta-galactoside alpha-(2,6)-sialyltransferase n=1 Tax=Notodromas monacha TaxID=399045 RepID=A0A7R9BX31_9CRUS|nr:unnamed protein product [Notodromas monacha]CAG0921808.1 unnamed protein product [Notodromas monacha]